MSTENYTYLDKFRYERKFAGDALSQKKAEVLLKTHPEMFRESYPPRLVNNIYFDTPSLEYYADNHQGKNNRQKFRIRWYGNLFGEVKGILEIKIKKGLVGIKKSFPLIPFIVDENLSKSKLIEVIKASKVDEDIVQKFQLLEPVLVNRYSRKYFENFNRKFRVTFDSEMCFYQFNRNIRMNDFRQDKHLFVIELKYFKEFDKEAGKLTQYFPFRLSKNSKYVNGIEKFFPGIAI